MDPWHQLGAASADGLTLDNPECDDYRQVTYAHMTQTATDTTASGFANHYGKIPHKFTASVVVTSPTPVGQVLVCYASFQSAYLSAFYLTTSHLLAPYLS